MWTTWDLSTASFAANNDTYLNQSFTLGYNFAHWRLNLRAQSYQNLLRDLDDTYRQLPRISFDGQYQLGDFGLVTCKTNTCTLATPTAIGWTEAVLSPAAAAAWTTSSTGNTSQRQALSNRP